MKDMFTIALVGNPNSGKTTLFNLLTKRGSPVGNRAGVTVSPEQGHITRFAKHKNVFLLDLPGIYSLSDGIHEELSVIHILKKEKIRVLLNVVDSTNLERGLFLTISLLRLGIPTVIALSMMDEADRMGIRIDIARLSQALGVRVFPISAIRKQGIQSLLKGCLQAQAIPSPFIFSTRAEAGALIHRILSEACQTEHLYSRSLHMDSFLCRPLIGIPVFLIVMSIVFSLTFSSLGEWLSHMLEKLFLEMAILGKQALMDCGASPRLSFLLMDGIWMGVSSVLAFIPQTAILFFLLALLDDCGYLARAVFVMDGLMHRLGISGKAIIPMIIGFGCTVPAVMATATLDDAEKKQTLAALPFIPCNARLPIVLLIASSFFEDHAAGVCIALYFLCIMAAFISALLFQKGEQPLPPMLMELPKYRAPRAINLLCEVKNRLKEYFIRAATVVFLSCVIINLLALLLQSSAIGNNGHLPLHSILSCFGFGDARLAIALATGFFAKESIVSAIQILIPEGLPAILSPAAAFSFALYCLLYIPCAATLSALWREGGKKLAIGIFLRSLLIASAFSYICYTFIHFLSK